MYASVVLDIPTRSVDKAFDYAVPADLAATAVVGSTVLVPFGNRPCVGYVVGLADEIDVDKSKIKAVEKVLAPAAFDEDHAALALWMAREYGASLASCVRLLLAPGQTVKLKKSEDGAWELAGDVVRPKDEQVVVVTDAGRAFTPKKNASKQRAVLEALESGPVTKSELSALIPGAGACVKALEKKGLVEVVETRAWRGGDETTLSSATAARPEKLTKGQELALETISESGPSDVVLVEGVTGSGKTEVYLAAIEEVLSRGQGAIVLVPEISLTAQTVGRFRSRFGSRVAVLHSKLSAGERYDQFDLIRQGKARVVVGARSALFAPVGNLGLIVIDEEHETSYKQDSAPRYVARDVAVELARMTGAKVVLGSATPSFEARVAAEKGRYAHVVMDERAGAGELPDVVIVDMKEEFARGNRTIFSAALKNALDDVVERGRKAVLLLNRRGFASFLMCRECGCVPECPHCATSLTYHERTHELVCHSCGRTWPMRAYPSPGSACPACGSRYLAQMGLGTQRVEDELKLLYPDTPLVRMDADTTKTKGAHQKLLEEFDAAESAILVGTQMIAKGLDFPDVVLVGVINADMSLKLPDFRAPERTYDLLEQVAGRAGRGVERGRVVIQTYWKGHPVFDAVGAHDASAFVAAELEQRAEAQYPPYVRLCNVIATGYDKRAVLAAATAVRAYLDGHVRREDGWKALGPAPCEKSRVRDRWRMHVLLKAPLDSHPGELLAAACAAAKTDGVSLAIDVDAYDLM
jgi:primosomal protein N' (replication factor Y)